MSEENKFRQYAEEAMRWAAKSTTAKEKRALLDLARTWSQAAIASEDIPMSANYSPTDHRTAA